MDRLKENNDTKIKELKDTLEVAKRMTKLRQAASASSSIQSATSGLQEQTAALEEENTRLETELSDMTEQMESYRDQLDDALGREADLRSEIEAQEDAIDELHSKLLDAQIEATHLKGDVEELELQKQRSAAARSRKSSLRGATQSSTGSLAESAQDGSPDHAGASGLCDTSSAQGEITPLQLGFDAAPGNSEGIPKRTNLAKIGRDGPEPSDRAVGGESSTESRRGEGDAVREEERPEVEAEVDAEATQKVNHYKSRAAFFWAASEEEASKVRHAGTVQMKPKPSVFPPKKSPRSEMAHTRPTASDDAEKLRLGVLYE